MRQGRGHHPQPTGDVHEIVFGSIPPASAGATALDAACGSGAVARLLAERGFSVDAVDLPGEAPFEVPLGVRYLPVDLNGPLPFQDESFDLAVSIETLEHLERPWSFLRELSRVLRAGGTVILTTPNVASMWSRVSFFVFGRPLWFHPWDLTPLGHITPIFPHILMSFAEASCFTISGRTYSRGRIPLLRVALPFHSALLGECVIFRLIKQ